MSEGEGMEHPDMSSDITNDNQLFSAEYRDGQLQIVEVSAYDKTCTQAEGMYVENEDTLPKLQVGGPSGDGTRYIQVMEDDKGVMQLDLINFTLIKNEDGSSSYQMSCGAAPGDGGDGTTITCVLSDQLDEEPRESYVMLEADEDQDPFVYLQGSGEGAPPVEHSQTPPATEEKSPPKKPLTPIQILEKAKALQKAKARLTAPSAPTAHALMKAPRGRKKSDLPPPLELLSSPNFKLYLYSCKLCTFKCNAVKEMSAHKKSQHSGMSKVGLRACLQCARCPYRAYTSTLLMKHVRDAHTKDYKVLSNKTKTAIELDCEEVQAADVLVCGACGFESDDRSIFKKHIEDDHGATTTVL